MPVGTCHHTAIIAWSKPLLFTLIKSAESKMKTTDTHDGFWTNIVENGLNARTVPLGPNCALSLFKWGPVVAAYPNFPFGLRSREEFIQLMCTETLGTLKGKGVDLLRLGMPASVLAASERPPLVKSVPETVVNELESWSLDALSSIGLYKVRRAVRDGIRIRNATAADCEKIFNLYRHTIKKHNGRLRYTHQYFQILLTASSSGGPLRISVADTPEASCVGFIATLRRGATTFYLHGGFDRDHARMRPGFALMSHLLGLASKDGCARFNMMASPTDQPELIRYKERWGGDTSPIYHWDIAVSAIGKIARLLLTLRR